MERQNNQQPSHRRERPFDAPGDREIIIEVQSGAPRAFGELVRRYQDRVYNLCRRMCANSEDAQDLTQETFLNAFRRIESFRLDSRFYTWLFRIAVNLCVSHRRKTKRRSVVSLHQPIHAESGADRDETPADRIADPRAPSAAREVADEELHERLSRAIAELRKDYRAVVVLRDIEGLDYADIVEILDVPPGTVKSRLHRARLELGDALKTARTGEPR